MCRFQGTNRKDLRGPRNVVYGIIYLFFYLKILNLQRLTCFKIRYGPQLNSSLQTFGSQRLIFSWGLAMNDRSYFWETVNLKSQFSMCSEINSQTSCQADSISSGLY